MRRSDWRRSAWLTAVLLVLAAALCIDASGAKGKRDWLVDLVVHLFLEHHAAPPG